MPTYIIILISSYMNNRILIIDEEVMEVAVGVPQGSVLGPLLWTTVYDSVLSLILMEGMELVLYMDDF